MLKYSNIESMMSIFHFSSTLQNVKRTCEYTHTHSVEAESTGSYLCLK